MAGHSKWANIKHRKAGVDKKRGLMFSKSSKELMVAAKLGGADVATNNRLRIAIAKAKAVNMPNDTIERAVKKGAGELEGQNFEEFLYEVYATNGIALLVEGISDKMSRTTPEIKNILTKAGASLADSNAVKRLFHYCGYISLEKEGITEDELMDLVLEAGVEDIKSEGDIFEVTTPIESFAQVSEIISEKELITIESGLKYIPLEGTEVTIDQARKAQKIINLIDKLEEYDDVQSVYSNIDIPDNVLAEMVE